MKICTPTKLTQCRAAILLAVFLLFSKSWLAAQNTRIADHNRIGWFAANGNFNLGKNWSLHLEGQWRRENFVKNWQQGLLRAGLGYQLHPKVQLRLGYAWAETFPYGDYPINALGKVFSEHRMFQMVTLTDKVNRLGIAQRFMLEQRWIGRFKNADSKREDEFAFANRLRYLIRLQIPLKGKTLDDREFYAVVYDEILIGFGKNVNENVFDQNRLGLLLGYSFSKNIRVEAGYFGQIVQLGREVTLPDSPNGRNVFQYNRGLLFNTIFNF